MIVHEGVHAWADLSNFKKGLSDECAAYVTEVLYLHAVNRRLSGHPIYDAANEVVATQGLDKRHGVSLTREQCQSLRDAIKAEPAYQSLSDS